MLQAVWKKNFLATVRRLDSAAHGWVQIMDNAVLAQQSTASVHMQVL